MRTHAVGDEMAWAERLRAVTISKEALNAVVMNYLVVEGHKEAAERFQAESGTPVGLNLDTIADRRALRAAIECGDVTSAIERAEPYLSPADTELHFSLRQQRLLELIRQDEVEAAVSFAQEELAPRAEQSAALLAELERTMLLLAFDDPRACGDGAELLSQAHRQKTASLLNAAVLTAQSQDREAALPMILRRLQWTQDELRHRVADHHAALPSVSDVARGEHADVGAIGTLEGPR